jgi:hypothetical protein
MADLLHFARLILAAGLLVASLTIAAHSHDRAGQILVD